MELPSPDRSRSDAPVIPYQQLEVLPSRSTAQTVPSHSRYEQAWLKHQLEDRPERVTESDAWSALNPNGVAREIAYPPPFPRRPIRATQGGVTSVHVGTRPRLHPDLAEASLSFNQPLSTLPEPLLPPGTERQRGDAHEPEGASDEPRRTASAVPASRRSPPREAQREATRSVPPRVPATPSVYSSSRSSAWPGPPYGRDEVQSGHDRNHGPAFDGQYADPWTAQQMAYWQEYPSAYEYPESFDPHSSWASYYRPGSGQAETETVPYEDYSYDQPHPGLRSRSSNSSMTSMFNYQGHGFRGFGSPDASQLYGPGQAMFPFPEASYHSYQQPMMHGYPGMWGMGGYGGPVGYAPQVDHRQGGRPPMTRMGSSGDLAYSSGALHGYPNAQMGGHMAYDPTKAKQGRLGHYGYVEGRELAGPPVGYSPAGVPPGSGGMYPTNGMQPQAGHHHHQMQPHPAPYNRAQSWAEGSPRAKHNGTVEKFQRQAEPFSLYPEQSQLGMASLAEALPHVVNGNRSKREGRV